jgi:hypothetical protein
MAEAAGVAPEPLGPGGGGEDHTGTREQGAAGGVEVVAVVVMAEQDRVDWTEVGGVIAGPVSSRHSPTFHQGRRAAEVGDPHGHAPALGAGRVLPWSA